MRVDATNARMKARQRMHEWRQEYYCTIIIRNMELVYKLESYDIIGLCMEVHNNPGAGF